MQVRCRLWCGLSSRGISIELKACKLFTLPTDHYIPLRFADALVKLLHFNGAYQDEAGAAEVFKVLVIDDYTLKVVATLMHTEALRQHGVTLVLSISKERESITDAPVVYFVRATEEIVEGIVHDVEHGLYREVCLLLPDLFVEAAQRRLCRTMMLCSGMLTTTQHQLRLQTAQCQCADMQSSCVCATSLSRLIFEQAMWTLLPAADATSCSHAHAAQRRNP